MHGPPMLNHLAMSVSYLTISISPACSQSAGVAAEAKKSNSEVPAAKVTILCVFIAFITLLPSLRFNR